MTTWKYIKEPFYSRGYKDGVKAERQRIKEEVEKLIKDNNKFNDDEVETRNDAFNKVILALENKK